jgi:hypothetical protein
LQQTPHIPCTAPRRKIERVSYHCIRKKAYAERLVEYMKTIRGQAEGDALPLAMMGLLVDTHKDAQPLDFSNAHSQNYVP